MADLALPALRCALEGGADAPNDPDPGDRDRGYLDTKGWVLFRLGRLDEWEKVLRRALVKGDDADVLAHLGDVLDKRARSRRPKSCGGARSRCPTSPTP